MYIGLFLIVERIDYKLSKRIIMKKILYFIWAILFISYFVIEYILIKNNFIDNTNILYQIVPIIVISIRMYVEIYEKKGNLHPKGWISTFMKVPGTGYITIKINKEKNEKINNISTS